MFDLYMGLEILRLHLVVLWNVINRDMYVEFLLSLFDFAILLIHAFLKQSLATPYVMMYEYVLQIKLNGERTPKLS